MSDATLDAVLDLQSHPIAENDYRAQCRSAFEDDGLLLLDAFLAPTALRSLVAEAEACRSMAFFSDQVHTVYLQAPDTSLGRHDARSRAVVSTKGAVTADQVPVDSPLRVLYHSPIFRSFLCDVLGEGTLHEYADPLSSININYFEEGQELGWHFDDSEFAVTLLLQRPLAGGVFEFQPRMRDSARGRNNETEVATVLDSDGFARGLEATGLTVQPGTLLLFRGRDALHRVTAVKGNRSRVLVVLAYNTEPGLALSESARLTFFGRLR